MAAVPGKCLLGCLLLICILLAIPFASASCGPYDCYGYSPYFHSTYYPRPGHIAPYRTMNGPYLGHVYVSREARYASAWTGYGVYSGNPLYGYASEALPAYLSRIH